MKDEYYQELKQRIQQLEEEIAALRADADCQPKRPPVPYLAASL